MEEALQELLHKVKEVITFLNEVKVDKKWNSKKEDLLATLNVSYNRCEGFLPAKSSSANDDGEIYDDVHQEGSDGNDIYQETADNDADIYTDTAEPNRDTYDDVNVSASKSALTIASIACEELKEASLSEFLHLKREKSLLSGAWQKKWCVLQHSNLYLYDGSKDKKQKDAFALNGFTFEIRDDITREAKRKERCFEIKHPQSGKSYEFCAQDKDSVFKWQTAILQASKLSACSARPSRSSLPDVSPTTPSTTDKKGGKFKKFAGLASKIGIRHSMGSADDVYDDTEVGGGSAADSAIYDDTDVGENVPNYDDTAQINQADEQIYDDTDQERELPPLPPNVHVSPPGSIKTFHLPPTPEASGPGRPSLPPVPCKSPTGSASGTFSRPLPLPIEERHSGSGTYRGKITISRTEDERGLPPLPPSGNLRHEEPPTKNLSVNDGGSNVDETEDYANLYQGMWDCSAEDNDELPFKRGEIVHIISREYDNYGWWIAKKNGLVGLVPREYLMEAYEI